jgi:putative SOS response-associated peptidase YedK
MLGENESMCGRYVRKGDRKKIAERFHAEPNPSDLPMSDADYNVPPTSYQPIIRQSKDTGARELILARWGLVPFFVKSLQDVKGISTINARAETIATAATWRTPFKKRRCLIPATAFYEWPKAAPVNKKEPKQPYAFELDTGGMFAFAGLWDAWKDAEGHWLQSYAIVTTVANELMSRIHDRMPVILHEKDYDRWLDREETERLPVDLLRPYESEAMEMHEANPLVNNVRNNGPEMLKSE